MNIKELTFEMDELWANTAFKRSMQTDPCTHVVTSKELAQVVVGWTNADPALKPHLVSVLDEAHRGNFVEAAKLFPRLEVNVQWTKSPNP